MSRENAANTTCSKGHAHPPWNTTGVLSIAKCESVCGFCHKETKTAANLRKHVAIHIKNEGLSLTIAEGSSGRGRLEMPAAPIGRTNSTSRMSTEDDEPTDRTHSSISPFRRPLPSTESFSPSAILMSMSARTSANSSPYTTPTYITTAPSTPIPTFTSPSNPSTITPFFNNPTDPFRALREHHLTTKPAWTVIPASEGFRILDLCKSLSVASSTDDRIPCYNRETIFDEEWQAHMKDVHGVFLLWPETWMRRIEVLDLDAFGGDIGACNDVIMDS